MKSQGLEPLEACRKIISSKIDSTSLLITAGQSMKNGKMKNTTEFSNNASLLGSLPEIPDLKDVPFITFCYEPSVENEAKDLLRDFGYVFHIAPVQVTFLILILPLRKIGIEQVLFILITLHYSKLFKVCYTTFTSKINLILSSSSLDM